MDTSRPYRPYLRRLTAYRSEPLYYTHVILFSPTEHSTDFHVHDRAELILAKSGTASITIESQVYRLKKNCLAIIRPNTLHRTVFADNSPYERYDLQFDHTLLGNGVFDRIPKDLCFIDCNGNHTLLGLFKKLDFYYQHFKGEDFRLLVKNTVEEILYHIYLSPPSDFQGELLAIHPTLKSALAYINRHYTEPISVEEVSSHLGITKSHLHHLFAQFMNTTPKKYINLQRLTKAQWLLQTGEKPSSIFACCGFGDYATFFRNYTAHFGYAPSQALQAAGSQEPNP
ncbi:MAG: helix-turn-helix transcriptional regulator [Oscillospiraceae bacterium]|nr:helix-turn-helix transcriptional regulator [Oscillospiraceae bacterium]